VGKDYEAAERAWVERLSRRYAQDFGPLARKYGIIGTPAQCAETIERFMAGGCNYFLMNPICEPADEATQLETIAADIMPRFRGR
jgi:alkanesulfonate monooxygenase SsuD/methylene tetrahydromethanopterin reductase-like flavin-dependent oxidoreductase (luciferase family)